MANNSFPTIVQPAIPIACLAPLELWLLTRIFQSEPDVSEVYFFAEESTASDYQLDFGDDTNLAEAIGNSRELCPDLCIAVERQFNKGDDLDFDAIDYHTILQTIVQRHRDVLPFVTITQAMVCDKMQPDGFGGAVTLITPDEIIGTSTEQWLDEQLIARGLRKPVPPAPSA